MWKDYYLNKEEDSNKYLKKKKEIERLIRKFEDEVENVTIPKNFEEENNLYIKKTKLENEIREWIDRYDREMCEKQEKIDEMDIKLDYLRHHIKDTENEIKENESNYKRIIDEQSRSLALQKAL